MKKLILLMILCVSICSCEKIIENLTLVRGGVIVSKTMERHDSDDNTITVRVRGRLIKCKVTRFEALNYQLGDTIK